MMRDITGRRAGLSACAATALLVLTACSVAEDGADAAGPASASPNPVQAEQSPSSTPEVPSPSPTSHEPPAGTPSPDPQEGEPVAMPASEPATITLPAIGVESELMQLGLQEDGKVEVPPFNLGSPAGWFVHSPTPGEVGPSVILGHRNGIEGGPGIFADVPQLEIGDSVEVTRQDGSVATFTVYRTELFGKEDFPTLEVYGNTTGPEIRLITCDGLNTETGILEDNFIIYATLNV